jgi:hypothetical protein
MLFAAPVVAVTLWLAFSAAAQSRRVDPPPTTTYSSGIVETWDSVTVYVTNPTNSAKTFTVTLRKDDGTVLFSTRRTIAPHAIYATFKGCPGQTRAQSCTMSEVITARTAALAPSLVYEVPTSDANGFDTGFTRYEITAGGFSTTTG